LFGLCEKRFCLTVRQRRDDTIVEPETSNPQRLTAALRGRFGKRDLLFGLDNLKIGVRCVGNEREIERALRSDRSEILAAGRFAQVRNPTPKVQFERTDANSDIESVEGHSVWCPLDIADIERRIDA